VNTRATLAGNLSVNSRCSFETAGRIELVLASTVVVFGLVFSISSLEETSPK